MTDNLLKYNIKDKKFLCFDYETQNLCTCLPTFNQPWQIGYCITDGYNITQQKEILIKWDNYEIDPKIAAMCHYNQGRIDREGLTPLAALETFEKELYNPEYIIITNNGMNFDFEIHNNFRRRMGKKTDYSYMSRQIDIQALAKMWKLNLKPNPNDSLLAQQYKFMGFRKKGLKTNLTQLCKDVNLDFNPEEAHSATYDCEYTFKVFIELVKILGI